MVDTSNSYFDTSQWGGRSSPIRVAHVVTGLHTGGVEVMLERLLMTQGPKVQPVVISLTDIGAVGQRLVANGVDVRALGLKRGQFPNLRRWWRLVQMLREYKPDVVHTSMTHSDLIGGLAARVAGVPAVMWGIHLSNLDPKMNSRTTLLTLRVNALLSHLVPKRIACVAERARQAHVGLGYAAKKFVVIPNGYDMAVYQPDDAARASVRAELGLAPDTPLVGVVGRFDVLKNHQGFCEAMGHLQALRPGTHALLAGADIDAHNTQLAGWLQAHGVQAVCHLLGPRTDIPRLMASLDVLLLPSWGEAFPNVVGEAMSSGVPCVVTDVGDAGLMVGDTGRMVAVGDMRGLAQAAAALLALPPLELALLRRRVAQSARERFDLKVVAQRVFGQYLGMLDDLRR
jgi:glycosyltransferase involved in cell wall biosynthesis